MLRFKPHWLEVEHGPHDLASDLHPEQSLEDWRKAHGMRAD
jgi:hypothetical protein